MRRVGFPPLRLALRAELRQIAPAPYPVLVSMSESVAFRLPLQSSRQ